MQKIKHLIVVMLSCVLILSLVSCSKSAEKSTTTVTSTTQATTAKSATDIEGKTTINVFAAASLTEAMENAKKLYTQKHPEVDIALTFDSSGTLKTQIELGAPCDIFVSAAQKQMNALDIASEKNEDQLDFIDSSTRRDVLENKVVLAVPANNPANVKEFTDITKDEVKKIALGNSDVPVGKYSEELYKNLGIWDQIQDKVSWGSNVKEVTTWVAEGAVDCGVVYATDANSAKLEIVNTATSDMIKTPVIYPAAVLKNSANAKVAKDFLDFVFSDQESVKFFEEVGFKVLK